MQFRVFVVLVLVTSLVACSTSRPTEPGRSLSGTYVLTGVDGDPLPTRVFADQSGNRTTDVIDGELVFEGPETVNRRIRWLNTDRDANSALVYQRFGRLRYRVDEDVVILEAGDDYSRSDTALVTGATIRVRADVQTEGGPVIVQAIYQKST